MDIDEINAAWYKELHKIWDWQDAEIAKIDEELKAKGLYRIGLDANQIYYKDILRESRRRADEVTAKYKKLAQDSKKGA